MLGTLAQARSLDSREEAALFYLADLGPVDLSPKTVTVEVYVAPEPELADCRRMLAQVWEQVQQFYARMGVNLVGVPGAQPGPLAPAKHLRIELLDRQAVAEPKLQGLRRGAAFSVALPPGLSG